MDAQEYCELVEKEDLRRRKKSRTIRVADDNSSLVSLKDSGFNLVFEPSIIENYGYFIREAVFEKIGRISKRLDQKDKKLIVRSVWRSFIHQRIIWDSRVEFLQRQHPEIHPHEIMEMAAYFIAPETRSMHSTGGAVDALIYDVKKDRVADFGTNDGLKIELSRKCYSIHPDIKSQAQKNRRLLIDLFEEEGFVSDPKEFWHFDYGNIIWAAAKDEACAIYDVIEALGQS